jgi:diguanylate cyclase (GGDEF)-like protein
MTEHQTQIEDSKPLVVLVDDSIVIHRLLTTRLKSESIELACFESGEKALEFALNRSPSLFLLDIEMPGMDGYMVLRKIKDEPSLREVPIIMLSGLSSADDKVIAFDLGANDFITKPFEIAELRARIRAALRLHSLLQMLAQRAQVDGLTGLWNRAHFDEHWQTETSRISRHSGELSLALLDLDNFKSINDTYGHPAGDEVLAALAKLITKTLRRSDLACRYGGEEFAIIMPATSPTEASAVCERIREGLESMRWPRHPEREVTVSIGIAGSKGNAAIDPGKWIAQADKQLYNAKHAGRNRLSVIDLDETHGPRLADAG